ncbi:hypothetical protein [Capnocytophaga sputigena]
MVFTQLIRNGICFVKF